MKTQAKLTVAACVVGAAIFSAQANAKLYNKYFEGDGWTGPQIIFHHYKSDSPLNPDSKSFKGYGSYRIPGIVATSQGTLIAVADKRFDGTTGNTDIVSNPTGDHPDGVLHKVWFSYKVSYDGGLTWSEERFLRPEGEDKTWKSYIGDPQIVHNPDTGSTFVFGYQSSYHIGKTGGPFDIIVYKSTDGGRSWDTGKSIKSFVNTNGWGGQAEYKALQGPGNGMYYNGKLYVPVQIWGGGKATSGMLVSADDGKTWQQSSWLIPDPSQVEGGKDKVTGNYITSEANVFHHKGAVYLTAKPETVQSAVKRLVWRTYDDGKTWEQVTEDFIPDNVKQCESSSFSLTDNIYFAGYTTGGSGQYDRDDIWISTNTGRRIKVYSKELFNNTKSMGYTSITADADNIYILFEGTDSGEVNHDLVGAMLLRRFDYAGKEYANLNGRLQRTGSQLLTLTDTFSSAKQSYMQGGYGSDENAEVEGVYVNGKYKVGLFYDSTSDVADDVYRTYGYDETSASALLGIDGLLVSDAMFSDTLFAGYQYTTTEFSNAAKEKSHAAVAGYRLNVKTDYVDYTLTGAYRHATNKLERNHSEGLGKEAEYSTDIISVDNRVSKDFALSQSGSLYVRPFAGFEYMNFKHEAYGENHGNGFNDITVDSASNNSYGPYIGAELFGDYTFVSGIKLNYSISARYKREMADVEDWADSYTVFDDKFRFATPVDKDDFDNIFEGRAEVMLDLNQHASLGLKATASSIEDSRVLFQCEYRF